MGIAGFFLWLQRFYNKCIEDVPQEFVDAIVRGEDPSVAVRGIAHSRYDNFYVDMNGLIHPCCHDTAPLPEPENEEEMFDRMFQQLDILVKVVRPRKCLVLCVDGVAPRSKMNQQRSRRFRAADERIESDGISNECAKKIVEEFGLPRPRVRERWDSNVITPSTAFMERMGLAIEWFIMKKLNEDPSWRNLAVVFSDAHVPGEGEHKIMHYIRGLRSQPGYNHRTSHVIHGMDADLVCLGLSTHEEHVSVLRNQLTETFQPDHNRFCYFNLHTYRALLKKDFENISDMDFERVLDDFIFLCFFVGNDFLPHVPLISIKTKGIEMLLDHYVRDFDKHTYLTKGGEVNYARLSCFLRNFVSKNYPKLQREYYGVVRARERAKQHVEERVTKAQNEIEEVLKTAPSDKDNAQEVSDKVQSLMTSCVKERVRLVADQQELGFSYLDADYRDKYYQKKFGWNLEGGGRAAFENNVKLCCAEYLRGMQWVMRYYTKGCPSWEWYYPFHYAPLLQDMASFTSRVDVEMRISAPLHPVEQLLAVLPRLSVNALPEELHEAVNDPNSVLGKFYPDRIDVDFSEANFSYQGVLRIPFINCNTLHEACQELVELEEDVGTTLLFCNESNPLSRQLERLMPTTAAAAIATTDGPDASYAVAPITSDVAAIAPIAGRVGVYEGEWPRHARLDCPDPGLRKQTSYGGPINDNAVQCYRYELNTHADYKQRLLGRPEESISSSNRRRERGKRSSSSYGSREDTRGSSRRESHSDSNRKRRRDESEERGSKRRRDESERNGRSHGSDRDPSERKDDKRGEAAARQNKDCRSSRSPGKRHRQQTDIEKKKSPPQQNPKKESRSPAKKHRSSSSRGKRR